MESIPDAGVQFEIIGILICLFFSAFFSGTETALTTLSDTRIHQLLNKHPNTAALLNKWHTKPSLVLSTLLIGNNLVNIIASILGARVAQHYLASFADAVAVGVMTFVLLLFGEITPKTYAKLNAEKIILPAIFILRLFDFFFSPIAIIFSKISRLFVKILGGKDVGDGGFAVTQHEIEYLIKTGSEMGVFEKEEQGELLNSVVEFKDTQVDEIMIPRTDANFLETTVTVKEALEKIWEWGHSRIPVYEENIDNIKGILIAKSLVALFKDGKVDLNQKIEPFIRKPVIFAPETQKINETLKLMQSKRTHLAVVVDEFGGTAGIITLEDILEELVGDIKDEVDKEEDPITKLKDNVISVDAHISIFDLEEELGIMIPDDGEYNSLGGFITAQAGSVPARGYKFEYEGHQFRVAESDERHITRVEIKKLPQN